MLALFTQVCWTCGQRHRIMVRPANLSSPFLCQSPGEAVREEPWLVRPQPGTGAAAKLPFLVQVPHKKPRFLPWRRGRSKRLSLALTPTVVVEPCNKTEIYAGTTNASLSQWVGCTRWATNQFQVGPLQYFIFNRSGYVIVSTILSISIQK